MRESLGQRLYWVFLRKDKARQSKQARIGCKLSVGSGFRGGLCLSDTSLWDAFQQGTYWRLVCEGVMEVVGTIDLGQHMKGMLLGECYHCKL